jgi:hypothetical protein
MRALALFPFLAGTLIFADSLPAVVRLVDVRGTKIRVDLATQVGQPYDALTVREDVRKLWNMGRFEDVRVETTPRENGTAVVFRVVETQPRVLHKILIEPSTFGLQLTAPEGTPMNRLRAHALAVEARKQLQAQGYSDPRVDYRLTPFVGNQVDVRLNLEPGVRVRVKQVTFTGKPGINAPELNGALRALKIRRVLPRWRIFPAYTPEAAQSDLARLRSLYLSRGYFDSSVRLDDVEVQGGEARVSITIDPGPLSIVRTPVAGVCSNLLAVRREAERAGVLDFSATLEVRNVAGKPGTVDLAVSEQRGPVYRVGRIDFAGNHHYSDGLVRRNFLLDEGQWLDQRLLRKSMARLNAAMLFEPITERNIVIRADEKSGIADVRVQLTERKGGAWRLSGPVGPASFAGPLEASLSSRLPAWGSGLVELGSYTASISLLAFARPLVPLLSVAPHWPLLPVLALQRPYSPGEGWKSGFVVAPQLGWSGMSLRYSATQIEQRLYPWLAGDRGLTPELPVRVEGAREEAFLICEPRKPRLMPLRTAALVSLRLLGTITGL